MFVLFSQQTVETDPGSATPQHAAGMQSAAHGFAGPSATGKQTSPATVLEPIPQRQSKYVSAFVVFEKATV
jgi:hypothetical protein